MELHHVERAMLQGLQDFLDAGIHEDPGGTDARVQLLPQNRGLRRRDVTTPHRHEDEACVLRERCIDRRHIRRRPQSADFDFHLILCFLFHLQSFFFIFDIHARLYTLICFFPNRVYGFPDKSQYFDETI